MAQIFDEQNEIRNENAEHAGDLEIEAKKPLFASSNNDTDGQALSVKAERQWPGTILIDVAHDYGKTTLYLSGAQASWLSHELLKAIVAQEYANSEFAKNSGLNK